MLVLTMNRADNMRMCIQVNVGYISQSVGFLGYAASINISLILGLSLGLGLPLLAVAALLLRYRRHCRKKTRHLKYLWKAQDSIYVVPNS